VDEQQVMAELVDARYAFLEGRRGRILELSFWDAESSSVVQKAIEKVAAALNSSAASHDDWLTAQALLADLRGNVRAALDSRHANHVIKQLVQLMPTEYVGFVAAELVGAGWWAASHEFGCRVVLRLVHHCGGSGQASKYVEALMNEVLAHAGELCRKKFGRFVLLEILEHGLPHQRRRVAKALRDRLLHNAMNMYGSHSIECALAHCDTEDAQAIAAELLSSLSMVRQLSKSEFGSYVLKALALSDEYSGEALQKLRLLSTELAQSRRGKRLLDEVPGLAAAQGW